MSLNRIPDSELVLQSDGSVYHLHLQPHQIASTIITVGDPARVADVSKHFDTIQHKVQYREFITHTGYFNNKHLTVLSTGIGTDNIDIVMNELDALANIDLSTRTIKEEKTSLDIIRLGTSGSVDENIPIESLVVSEYGIGMDGLLNFYTHENTIQETVYLEAFTNHIRPYFKEVKPYIAPASDELLKKFDSGFIHGTTLTACGFYAPQGRILRAQREFPNFVQTIHSFRHKHFRITNLEMETAGIYGLGRILGHRCLSINVILANRVTGEFSTQPKHATDKMIEQCLEIITK